jgi:hypothetical protein
LAWGLDLSLSLSLIVCITWRVQHSANTITTLGWNGITNNGRNKSDRWNPGFHTSNLKSRINQVGQLGS